MEATTGIEVFHDDADGVEKVGMLLKGASIVEDEGELAPGCTITPWQARCLASALVEIADRIENAGS